MRTWTNMAWPDDPYRTGQQLYRRPVPRLAAFTTCSAAEGGGHEPAAVAIVYLPLHRTQAVSVREQTLTFGFRAASSDPAGMPAVAAVADLDLLQARRHAAVLAGHLLASEMAAVRQAAGEAELRGLVAVEREWAVRGQATGRAATFDCGLDLPGSPPLELACQQAGIHAHPAGSSRSAGQPADQEEAVRAVERALMIALVCARHLGRYDWTRTLRIRQVMTATTWDCLPWPGAAIPARPAARAAVNRAEAAASATCRILK